MRFRNSGRKLARRIVLHLRAQRLGVALVIEDDVTTDVARHDDHGVAGSREAAARVGEPTVVEHLQEDVEDVGMRLLDLVEEHHAVGSPPHRLGEEAALVAVDVAGRRAEQPRDRVLLHELAHVEARQRGLVVEEKLRERLGQLGLADARRPEEEERADRLLRIAQPDATTAHGLGRPPARASSCPTTRSREALLHRRSFVRLALEHLRRPARRSTCRDHGGDVLLRDHVAHEHRALGARRVSSCFSSSASASRSGIAAEPDRRPRVASSAAARSCVSSRRRRRSSLERASCGGQRPRASHLARGRAWRSRPRAPCARARSRRRCRPRASALDLERLEAALDRVELGGRAVDLDAHARRGLVDQIDRGSWGAYTPGT